jgi:hypothetical protein
MLAACPELTHVECTNIMFKTSSFQAAFARTAVMDTVILHNCTIPLDGSHPYRFKNVRVAGPPSLTGFAAENHRYAVASLLSPVHLLRLQLDMPDLIQDLLSLLIAKDDFTSLRAVNLSVPPGAAWPELDAFSKKWGSAPRDKSCAGPRAGISLVRSVVARPSVPVLDPDDRFRASSIFLAEARIKRYYT